MLSKTPQGWQERSLASLAKFINGRAFKPSEWTQEGLPIIRIAQITNPCSNYNCFSGSDVEERHRIRKGDLLFSWSATLTAVIWEHYEAVLNQHIFKVEPLNDVSKSFLLYRILLSIDELLKGAHGTTMRHIKKRELDVHRILLPPLNEQHRIAEILSSVDASIQATQAVIEQAERVKRGLMKELLTGGLGSEAIERGEVPEGWCLHAPISNYIKNKTQKWNGYEVLPYIGLEHIEKGSGRLLGFGESGDIISSKNVFEEGDVLFGKLRPNLRKYWRANKRGICSTDILILRSQKEMLNEYLFIIVQSELFLAFAENDAAGTKMPRTSWKRLETIELPLPPLKEQKRIAEIILSFDELIGQQMLIAEKQTRTKRGLMDDLLTGKVRTV
jgi:type I restriction enzyme S subunit